MTPSLEFPNVGKHVAARGKSAEVLAIRAVTSLTMIGIIAGDGVVHAGRRALHYMPGMAQRSM